MNLDFGMPAAVFRGEYRYKKPCLFKNAVRDLSIGWNEINELYQRADPTDDLFRLRKGEIVPVSEYVERFNDVGRTRYRFNKPAVYQYLKNGTTIIYNRINNEPWVDDLAKQIAHFAGGQTIVSGYLAFGSDPSFKSHWDTRDVYAVQLAGKKRWTLSAPNFEMPLYMQQGKDMPHIKPPETVDMEVTLEAGDILYVPRGWWHNPVPLGCETFHLAIGVFPPNGYNYMEWLMKKFPEIPSLRRNFTSWDEDNDNIDNMAQEAAKMIADEENYRKFMSDFLGGQRTDSAFLMDVFGNPNMDKLPKNCSLRLNSIDLSTLKQDYLIANGFKINVDDISRKVFELIAKHEPIPLTELLMHFEPDQQEKVSGLLYQLGALDVVEVLR